MKRFVAAALAALLLLCFTSALASSPGSAADPLVSLEYIKNTLYPALVSEIKTLAGNAVGSLYAKATKDAEQIYSDAMLRLGGLEGYDYAGSYTAVGLPIGKTAELVTGSTVVLAAGSAALQVTRGTVVNISTGTEVPNGTALTPDQRYFCAEDTAATVASSADAVCLIDGYYKTSGSVIENPFTDVRITDWYFTAVNYAGENNLFKGTSATAFSPQDSMTRGMFVTVLYRLAGKPAISSATTFPDTALTTEYFHDAVIWASMNNIVTGYDDGMFYPNALITREQMAVIMYRYAAHAGHSTAATDTGVYGSFPDQGSVSAFAGDAMKWAVSARLINGSDGSLLPQNTATRAQVAQIILNFCRYTANT